MTQAWRWVPALVLGIGALFTVGMHGQRTLPLRADLSETIPAELAGLRGVDVPMAEWELELAGVDDYLYRVFSAPGTAGDQMVASLYVGYYMQQAGGRTIHSPKNCLPGSGWQALDAQTLTVGGPSGPVQVNRYVITNDVETALVLYWYQGRGRVEANEYVVKLDLLRDAAFRRRSEEALVRIVVPLRSTEAEALDVATRTATAVMPALDRALPL